MKINKVLFYLLNFTWGIIMNIIGAIAALIIMIIGVKPEKNSGSVLFRIGHNWGGVSLGIFTFVCRESGEHTLNHEFGHSIQNALFGPAFPFIVAIPSSIRYWTFTIKENKGIKIEEDYDDAWFEGQATKWGTHNAQNW